MAPEVKARLMALPYCHGRGLLFGVMMETKKCSRCEQLKPIGVFPRMKHPFYGVYIRPECRECYRRICREQGRKRTPEYQTWLAMRSRCNHPGNASYHRYGGRGISVCERWDSYKVFLADMGPKPAPRHQIDRIDNDGNYEPSNCRWLTVAENSRRRPSTKLSIAKANAIRWYHGFARYNSVELSKMFGVSDAMIRMILMNKRWVEQ